MVTVNSTRTSAKVGSDTGSSFIGETHWRISSNRWWASATTRCSSDTDSDTISDAARPFLGNDSLFTGEIPGAARRGISSSTWCAWRNPELQIQFPVDSDHQIRWGFFLCVRNHEENKTQALISEKFADQESVVRKLTVAAVLAVVVFSGDILEKQIAEGWSRGRDERDGVLGFRFGDFSFFRRRSAVSVRRRFERELVNILLNNWFLRNHMDEN